MARYLVASLLLIGLVIFVIVWINASTLYATRTQLPSTDTPTPTRTATPTLAATPTVVRNRYYLPFLPQ